MVNLYDDAHIRTEKACSKYLEEKGFLVTRLGENRNSPNYSYDKNNKWEIPDLLVDKLNSTYVEVKAYDEALHKDIYKDFRDWKPLILQLKGISRFRYGQKYNFVQGLDLPQFRRFAYFQSAHSTKPILFAFCDNKLRTGVWYGAWLHEFVHNKNQYRWIKNTQKGGEITEQLFLPLSSMDLIENKLRSLDKSLLNYLSHYEKNKLKDIDIDVKEFFGDD